MYKRVNELISILEEEGKCEVKLVNREEHTYQIDSFTGLAWNSRATKFGEFRAGEEWLQLELDFPVQSFSAEELKSATGLPLKEEKRKSESFVDPVFHKASYDSVRVVISREELEDFSFQKEEFASWLQKVIDINIK